MLVVFKTAKLYAIPYTIRCKTKTKGDWVVHDWYELKAFPIRSFTSAFFVEPSNPFSHFLLDPFTDELVL